MSVDKEAILSEIRGEMTSHIEDLAGESQSPQDADESQNLDAGDSDDTTQVEADGDVADQEQSETLEEASDDHGEQYLSDTFNVAELAAAIDTDPEYLYKGLKVKLDNGEEIPLGEVKDRLQRPGADAEQVQQARQQLEMQQQQFMQHASQVLGVAQQVTEAEQRAYGQMAAAEAEFERIDWEKLDKADPGRAANEKQRLASQYAAGKRGLEEAAAQKQQLMQQQSEQAGQYYWQRTVERIPEYRDQSRAQQGLKSDGEYLTSIGYQPAELQGPIDDRFALMAHEARQWREYQAKLAGAQKQVRKAPKTLKPGQGIKRTQRRAKHEQQLIAKARDSGRRDDKLAALRASMGIDK